MNKRNNIYKRALNGGEVELEATCVGIRQHEWDKLMKGATRANKKIAAQIALKAGVIDEDWAKREIKTRITTPTII